MAIARLEGGPLDGQLIPLDDATLDTLILPYSETQITYERSGEPTNTGSADGPTQAVFRYVGSSDGINPDPDGRDE